MRLAFWSADEYGCGYYRCEEPARALMLLGHDCSVGTALPMETLTGDDVLIGQRVAKPRPTAVLESRAGLGLPTVIELDDDLFNLPARHPARPFWMDPQVRRRVIANVERADAVTVSTEHLADVVSTYTSAPIHVLPNSLPASIFELPPPPPSDVIRIGYTSGVTHDDDVRIVSYAAGQVSRRYAGKVSWHFFGHDHADRFGAHPAVFTPWKDSVPAYHASLDFDIGLAPLKRTPFNLSKSPIKALEYAARGIPVVASAVGPYPGFVKHGVTGFLAERDADWLTYLTALIDDADLRGSMGAAARRQVAEMTYEQNAWRWEEALGAL